MFYNSIKVFGEIFSDNFVAKWKNNRQTHDEIKENCSDKTFGENLHCKTQPKLKIKLVELVLMSTNTSQTHLTRHVRYNLE